MTTTLNASTAGAGGFIATSDNSGVLALQTAGTTAITVDASQKVGIGTASPSALLHVSSTSAETLRFQSTSSAPYQSFYNSSANRAGYMEWNTSALKIDAESGASSTMAFLTANTERMRIDSSGNLLVARTSSFTPNSADNTKGFGILADSGQTLVNATGSVNALIVNNTNTNNRLLSFRSANTEVGGVTITSSTATFNGTSDSRLKEDLGVSTDTSVIDNTIIHDFKWTRDGTQGKGVFAQEAYEVYPLAVSKGSDELNESGNLSNPWQVNYSQYIPDLIVYCQQLKKTVDTQAETINALTARIVALEGQ
jgi:hypothetical protein